MMLVDDDDGDDDDDADTDDDHDATDEAWRHRCLAGGME